MMRKYGVWFLALFFFLKFDGNAFGDKIIYVGLQGGWSSQKLDFRDLEFSRNTAFVYGLKAGVRILSLAVEGSYFQAAHNIDVADAGLNDRRVDFNHLGLSVKLFLPLPLVSPYLVGGYGRYSADIKGLGDDSNSGYNLGTGAELNLGERFSLFGEARYNNVGLTIDDEDLKISSYTFHFGLNYYF